MLSEYESNVDQPEEEKIEIGGFQDLEIYQDTLKLMGEVFRMTQEFPEEEMHGLTITMRNVSRSVPANIAEGWGKRKRETLFRRHLRDALGASNEMLVCFDAALACGYIAKEKYTELRNAYVEMGQRLNRMHANCRTYEQLFSDWKHVF